MTEQIAADLNDTDDPSAVPPLTRNNYARSAATEDEIRRLRALDDDSLIAAFSSMREGASDYVSAEALVFFIRGAHRQQRARLRDALVGLIVKRCQVYFRGAVRGFDPDTRLDIQNDVIADMIRLLIDPGDAGDFLEVRFWTYLDRKTVTMTGRARRSHYRAPLIGDLGDGDDEEGSLLSTGQEEQIFADADRADVRAALDSLPPELRELVVLRYFEDWQIGNERRTGDGPAQPTLAERYNCSPRTIHNHLVKARDLMKSHWKDEQ